MNRAGMAAIGAGVFFGAPPRYRGDRLGPRGDRRSRGSLRHKLEQRAIKRARTLDHRNVAGVLEHERARIRDPLAVLVTVPDRDDYVGVAPDDERRRADRAQPLAPLPAQVAERGVEGLAIGGRYRGEQALEHEIGAEPVGAMGDGAQGEPAQAWARGHRAVARGEAGAEKTGELEQSDASMAVTGGRDHPGSVDEHEALDPFGELDGKLGGDEATHRVADEDRGAEPEVRAEGIDSARVTGDRDVLARHVRLAEAGQIGRDHAPLLR